MSVYVREAAPDADRKAMVNLAQRYLDKSCDERRFRWLYRQNPFGEARAWLAIEADSDEPVGLAAVFPREAYIGDRRARGYVLGDFCVSEKYRTLGPALKLQRACLEWADTSRVEFCVDFPSAAMLAIYRHLQVPVLGSMVRMARILRTSNQEIPFFSSRWFAYALGSLREAAVGMTLTKSKTTQQVRFALLEGPFTEDYTDLAERIGSSQGSCTVRSAEYLNWRFRDHPQKKYETVTVGCEGKLEGYCTFTLSGTQATIVDLFGTTDEPTMIALIRTTFKLLRNRRVATVSAPLMADDLRINMLRRTGFMPRESAPVLRFGTASQERQHPQVLTYGDRES